MYLLINEDGALQTTEKVSESAFKEADDGLLEIIDVSGDVPMQYYNSGWHDINKA